MEFNYKDGKDGNFRIIIGKRGSVIVLSVPKNKEDKIVFQRDGSVNLTLTIQEIIKVYSIITRILDSNQTFDILEEFLYYKIVIQQYHYHILFLLNIIVILFLQCIFYNN